jgi:hypothetical protein
MRVFDFLDTIFSITERDCSYGRRLSNIPRWSAVSEERRAHCAHFAHSRQAISADQAIWNNIRLTCGRPGRAESASHPSGSRHLSSQLRRRSSANARGAKRRRRRARPGTRPRLRCKALRGVSRRRRRSGLQPALTAWLTDVVQHDAVEVVPSDGFD